jgi:ADP-ribosylation factor-binding protein GGA
MLDSYKPGISSADELDLIRELHQSCERLRPNLMKLATETQQNEEILGRAIYVMFSFTIYKLCSCTLGDVLQASDELTQVFSKFNKIIIQKTDTSDDHSNPLLDFDSSVNPSNDGAKCQSTETKDKSEIDVLCDIFNTSNIPDSDILQPVSILPCGMLNIFTFLHL